MEEQEIHLRDYLRIIDKRRYTVFTFFLITFAVVLVGTFTATPIYVSSAKVLIEKNAPENLLGRYAYDTYDPDFLETQYQIIKSFKVAQKVVRILDLEDTYDSYFPADADQGMLTGLVDWFKGFVKTLLHATGLDKTSFFNSTEVEKEGLGDNQAYLSKADMIAAMVSGGLEVSPVGNSRVVTISFQSESPELTSLIVNSAAKAYMEEIQEIKASASGQSIKWMTEKAKEERATLAESEQALQEYSKAKNIVTIEDRVTIIPQKLADFSQQLTRAETKRKELETLLSKIRTVFAVERGDLETISVIASSPAVKSFREQIVRAEQNIIEISKKYGHKHPVMIRARSDLVVLGEKKSQEIKRVIESIKNEYELARANEENIRKMLARTKDEAIRLNEKFIQYGILKREVESNRLLYEALIRRVKEQDATEQNQTVTIWMVEEAKTPRYPAKPRKKLNILLGIIVGLFGGVGLAFFIEYLDNTIKSPDETETKLGVTVLGLIEKFEGKDGAVIEQAIHADSLSSFAEGYKAIRSAVLLSSADKPPKTILVTSMSVQEGKTITAANLAETIAQVGYKVVLVDADMRRPSINKFFSIDNYKGLSTALCGISDKDIITELPDRNLSLIPSGPIPPNPSELLSSARMADLLSSLAHFDFVIIDSPPLLTVTDGLILHKMVEGTIVVARAEKTTYEACGKGLKLLNEINPHVLGVVINALDMRKSKYYDYGYYKSSYFTDFAAEEKWKEVIDRRKGQRGRRRKDKTPGKQEVDLP